MAGRAAWLRYTPGLRTLSGYRRDWLLPDVLAGLVLAAVILPVGMAYADLAGLPPVVGLYASLIPLFVYAILGPSRAFVVGPDSATASLVAAAVIPLAGAAMSQRVALGAMLALMVGVMCAVVGLGRLGFVTSLLSKPVRIGYMNGIAIAIIVSQLPALFGYKVHADGVFAEMVGFVSAMAGTKGAALAFGAGSLAVILVMRAFVPKVPGPLVVVVGSTVIVALVGGARFGLATVGTLPQGVPVPSWPSVAPGDLVGLAVAAFGIAIISLTDTSVLSASMSSRFHYRVDADEEFVAMGAANIFAGLFQGFPVSGSQTRTAAITAAGAKSPLAGLVAGVVLIVMLVALPWLVATLPLSVLAAIVISAGIELADVRGTVRLFYERRTEFALCLLSLGGVLVLGVLPGVLFAVALSVLNFMRRQWWPHDAVLGRVSGTKGYHDTSDFTEGVQVPGLLLWRFDAPLFFANASIFRRRLRARLDEASVPVVRVVLCAEPITDVDTTAADTLREIVRDLCAEGVEFAFAELKHPVREHLERYGLLGGPDAPRLYPTIGSAVHDYVDSFGVEWTDWQDAEDEQGAPPREPLQAPDPPARRDEGDPL